MQACMKHLHEDAPGTPTPSASTGTAQAGSAVDPGQGWGGDEPHGSRTLPQHPPAPLQTRVPEMQLCSAGPTCKQLQPGAERSQ